ncbi:hypothetical protein CL614_00030 [archaeon]|nr:hypothetical protein [archaeon]
MFNFDVLVGGRPVKTYRDQSGRIWIEGRKGTAFKLRVKNNDHRRILGIVSVDGLNVIDGKHLPPEDSRGYIINSYSNITIPGWKINQDEVREFYFTVDESESYVRKIGADERNIGVIAAAIYREKQPDYNFTYTTTWIPEKKYPDAIWYANSTTDNKIEPMGDVHVFNMSSEPDMSSSVQVNESSGYVSSGRGLSAEPEKVSVGSGERREFRTHKSNFERGVFEGLVEVFYDTWEGLKRRGILREDENYRNFPKAFPNGNDVYCPDR